MAYPANVAEQVRNMVVREFDCDSAATQATPVRPVDGSLAQLHEALTQLAATFERLESRLAPVMLKVATEGVPLQGACDNQPRPAMCEVHESIFQATRRADALIERMQRLEGLLQV